MPVIETRALRKVYPPPPQAKRRGPPPGPGGPGGPPHRAPNAPTGAGIVALDGLDLTIEDGEFFGLLGPNGAGKTTTIGILTTRVLPTSGEAFIAGNDVRAQSVDVRRRIGVVPQRPNPDRGLNAVENLLFHAAYFGIPTHDATARANALLDQLGIADKATAKVDDLSGGQQQRLMIARALMHEPRVLFLDEPTVGLDPQARHTLWDLLRELRAQGRTIVLTTHYMEEADQLCDRVAIIDRGKLLAVDAPADLKARAPGGTLIELTLDADGTAVAERVRALDGVLRAEAQGDVLRVYSARGGRIISALIQNVEDAGRTVRNIALTETSLETLFVSLTGRKLD
jgi:ABC-2 type transport system ATP-binding protein